METQDIISSGLLELYVLGMASVEESAQVVSWASQYPEVRMELDAIEVTMERYALAHAVEPGTGVREKALNGVGRTSASAGVAVAPQTAKVVGIAPWWKYAAAASIVALIGSALLNYNYYNKLQDTNSALSNTREELLAANTRLSDMNADMSVVQNRYSQAVSLNGLPAAPDAAAKIFWVKNTGEVYIDPSNLPEAPAGKQYQLWGIVDGKPVDGGMIITSQKDKKYRIQKMKTFGKAEAFAVTLETTGGSPTPKGDMYVLGEL